jgi:hypothetical protein
VTLIILYYSLDLKPLNSIEKFIGKKDLWKRRQKDKIFKGEENIVHGSMDKPGCGANLEKKWYVLKN